MQCTRSNDEAGAGSVTHTLLGLPIQAQRCGYNPRARGEMPTGGAWHLTVVQVDTTLDRFERVGLVERHEADADRQVFYAFTDSGRAAERQWGLRPRARPVPTGTT